ncbi:hypothetical protein OS242_08370 [Tumebacillus sp. DT12]|uniref:Uncharacterized protein n=1 Tax=Tumebacillus lacus TaxID=2995335 RepID=A0ABT3X207_9BACL|nr:hypothetical protein [Tumebacillus lacus]MCX7569978.1 hypothetical protein [Tumebacillus lacus]
MKMLKQIFGGIAVCAVLLSMAVTLANGFTTVAVEIGTGPLSIKNEAIFDETDVHVAVEVGPGPLIVKA